MGPLTLFVASPRWAACENGCAWDGLAHGYQEHGADLKACAGICGASAALPLGRAATNRFGSLEGAPRPPGWGGHSAAHARAAERMQVRSVIGAQLAGRIRARACTVPTDTGLARVPKH